MRGTFLGALPETGSPDSAVIEEPADLGELGLMQMTDSKVFVGVMGGSSSVSVSTDCLSAAWGQTAAMHVSSPAAAAVEEAAAAWLLDGLDLPRISGVGFASGGAMDGFTTLAAAPEELLRR